MTDEARTVAAPVAVGLMSGTSADGIDAAALELAEGGPRVVAHRAVPYPAALRARVLALASGEHRDSHEVALLHAALGDAYAEVASEFIATLDRRPEVIAVHGQTVAHFPGEHATLQLGDGARVALRCDVPVVSDFRSADVAAGGEGAPLVPFADHIFFSARAPIAVLNLGGIANVTLIPTRRPEDVVAFDTGPANMISDLLSLRAGRPYDDEGGGAARGRVIPEALERALAHPYFARPAPKSTGREEFGKPFADQLYAAVESAGGSLDDAFATASELVAITVADALTRHAPPQVHWRQVLVAGGGTRNRTLVAAITRRVNSAVWPTDIAGVPAAAREAAAFALLGAYRLRGLPNTLPRCTGASRAVSAGAIHRP